MTIASSHETCDHITILKPCSNDTAKTITLKYSITKTPSTCATTNSSKTIQKLLIYKQHPKTTFPPKSSTAIYSKMIRKFSVALSNKDSKISKKTNGYFLSTKKDTTVDYIVKNAVTLLFVQNAKSPSPTTKTPKTIIFSAISAIPNSTATTPAQDAKTNPCNQSVMA
jgi:hypothetical protein